ncbi:DMT family transporter [Zhihengliuella flava]|uniref:Transporter family-2 protein n=1 Tax=Zhihengliuella flava TaxID=1285193 RepID=A0A931D8C1_9MICC|nr:transporter family-2 protein [Zhihengliuella flava]
MSAERAALPVPVGVAIAVIAGSAMPLQGRVNGALSTELGHGIEAATISFGVGLLLLALACLTPPGRRGLSRLRSHVAAGDVPAWYLLAGTIGAFFVISQGLVVTILGVALFTVANVAGQVASGLVADRVGFGPGGPRPVSTRRAVGALLALVGVGVAVWPTLAERGVGFEVVGPLLLPLTAGLLMGFQQAMNGVQTRYAGSPLPATFVNFAVGTAALVVTLLVMTAAGTPMAPLPPVWWMYLGGPLGVCFIAASAVLVRFLGVLVTGLGLIAGQLLGSLAIDVFLPVAGAQVELATVAGTAVALGAVVIASVQRGAPGHR